MKKFFYKIAILATFVAGVSSCNDNDVPVAVNVGVGNGGVFINIYIGGSTNNGYYYPSNWGNSNEIWFEGYVEELPYSMEGVPITDGQGNTIIGPDGKGVFANVQTSMQKLQNWDYSKGPRKVSISGKAAWFYVIH